METDDRQVEGQYEVNLDDDVNTLPTQQLDGGNDGHHGYAGVAGDAAVPPVLRDGDLSVSDAEPVSTRPRRLPKPNKKYDPGVYDLSYVECRQGMEV